MPTSKNLADGLLALGIVGFTPFEAVPTSKFGAVGTRREWRIKKSTGELRGVSIRERNKGRKPVGWIDSEDRGWAEILASYERWRRTARYVVGTLEQRPTVDDRQPTSQDTRNGGA